VTAIASARGRPHMKSPTELARGFLTDAEAYLRAAQKLDQSVEGLASSPQYYLACHSIELIFKAFILIKGGTEDEVREIRHDLLKAWDRATELGLCPKDKRIGEIVIMMAPYHLDHSFRYRKTGFVTLPVYTELCEVVERLVTEVGPAVNDAMLSEILAKRATPNDED
jgi:hypothetical protein